MGRTEGRTADGSGGPRDDPKPKDEEVGIGRGSLVIERPRQIETASSSRNQGRRDYSRWGLADILGPMLWNTANLANLFHDASEPTFRASLNL